MNLGNLSAGEGGHDTLHAHETRALHEERRGGVCRELAGARGERFDVLKVLGLGAKAKRRVGGGLPKQQQVGDAAFGGLRADLVVSLRPLLADLTHVAQHQHTRSGAVGQHLDGRQNRVGVGVVAVIDQGGARGQGMTHQSPRGR